MFKDVCCSGSIHSLLLTNRMVINGQHSEWHHTSSGIPHDQGSILGPLFFIFYINNISTITKSKPKIFADDVTLFTSFKCKEDCLSLQADLDAIYRCCHLWQMKLHPLKCKVLCISNKCSPLKFDYKINDVLLKCRSFVKYLGIHIISKLSWNDQCFANTTKATRVLNIIRRNLFGCSVSTKSRAFRVLVLSILEYAAQVWNPHTKNIDKLEAIKLHDACWVCGSQYNRSTFA